MSKDSMIEPRMYESLRLLEMQLVSRFPRRKCGRVPWDYSPILPYRTLKGSDKSTLSTLPYPRAGGGTLSGAVFRHLPWLQPLSLKQPPIKGAE